MHKKILSSLSLFTAILFICSCHSGDAYTIKMRLNKGDTFNHNISLKMNINTSGANVKMNMDIGCAFEVTAVDSGSKDLKMTYKKMHTSMDMGGLAGAPDSILNKTNEKAIGKSVTLKLSDANQITDVSGMDSILNEGADSATRQSMQKLFSKDQFNSMFGMMFSMYPKTPVKIGESWNADNKVNMGGIDMNVNVKYTLVSVKDGLAGISVDGVIDGKGQMTVGTNSMSMDMSGTQKGMLTINMGDGYLEEGEYKMDIKADMEMMDQKIPMTLQAEYTLSGKL